MTFHSADRFRKHLQICRNHTNTNSTNGGFKPMIFNQ
uniref:Uncharacterized protein n=1 Tax=Arundo donax TaxID=35708 RepID=A0A0A9HMK5_ARUDO